MPPNAVCSSRRLFAALGGRAFEMVGCAGQAADGYGVGPGDPAYENLTALNLRICSVSAVSTGNRSMLEAP